MNDTPNLKFNTARRAAFLDCLRQGMSRTAAAGAVGIARQTYQNHAKKDPAFAAAMDDAQLDACEVVEDALFRTAVKGNITAIIFYLCNRSPARWQRNPRQDSNRRKRHQTLTTYAGG